MTKTIVNFGIGDVLIDKSTGDKAIITDTFSMSAYFANTRLVFFDVMVANVGTLKALSMDDLDNKYVKV